MPCLCGLHRDRRGCLGAARFAARRAALRQASGGVFEKPCARGGCSGVVTAQGPRGLARRQFCSHRCAYLERVRHGWGRHALTTEERRRGARLAGRLVGERSHRRALMAASARAFALLPRDIVDYLTPGQLVRLKVAIGRVWLEGRSVGFTTNAAGRRKGKAA